MNNAIKKIAFFKITRGCPGRGEEEMIKGWIKSGRIEDI